MKKTILRQFFLTLLLTLMAAAVLSAVVMVIGLRAGLISLKTTQPSPEPTEGTKVEETDYSFEVLFITPDEAGDNIVIKALPDEPFEVPGGPEIDGYSFLGWKDINGEMFAQTELTLNETAQYAAVYQVAFKDESKEGVHEAFMSLDEKQMFCPYEGLTKGECVNIIYQLLDTDYQGSGYFIDVEKDSQYYTAASTLKGLGLLKGNRLHPDETITLGEFYEILAPLFPRVYDKYDFTEVTETDEYYESFCFAKHYGIMLNDSHTSYDILSRYDAALIFNRLIGRKCTVHDDCSLTGTILDVSPNSNMYPVIADAVVTHTSATDKEGFEIWTDSEPYPIIEEGMFFIGSELHAVGPDGAPVVNGSYKGLDFDETGAETTGNHELDLLVRAKIQELCDPETQTPLEMFEILYNDVTYNSQYLRKNQHYRGEHGWEADEAYTILSTGKGNCYCFAGAVWALARGVGFDAKAYCGTVGINEGPHGWVEIEIDGTDYIFDACLQYEERYFHYTHQNFYMKTAKQLEGWNYIKYDGGR